MAVKECCSEMSPNKKSIFGLGLWSQILYLLLFTCIIAGASAADTEVSCANVRNIFEKKGILSAVDLQDSPTSDAGGLCRGRGCCGAGARAKLTQQARQQLEAAIRGELAKLADILANRAKRFDEFFRKLLMLSREGFHSMFKRTYGMIYEQHSYVFEQLFEQLERYYTKGDTDFDKMMDGFFGILYQKMFTVLNSQYNFDDKYLKCVNEHMRDIQPFEDVPHKLSVQLRRAFVATRTFHKALRSGAEVLRNMMQVEITDECATSWARLRFCGSCSGDQVPACSRYCHNVLRGCLATHADLRDQWDAYVDAVEKVADRLLGPFNIAMVVEPIDIKISEAIMSFQEHNQEISQKIFAGCGKPVLGGGGGSAGPFFAPDRARRFVRSIPDFDINPKPNDVDDFEIEASLESLVQDDPSLLSLHSPATFRAVVEEMKEQSKLRGKFLEYMRGSIDLGNYEEHERRRRDAEPAPAPGGEIDFRPYEFEGKRGGKKKKPAPKTEENSNAEWGGPALERLVRETRSRLRGSRQYWSQLPALLCAPVSITAAPCYNGTAKASYLLSAAGEGSAGLASNPEVRGGAGGAGGGAGSAQQDVLRALTARLKDAYNGVEVQWTDPSDEAPQSRSSGALIEGGSGSGLGSGDSEDNYPTDDEDRNAGNDYSEGSGARPDIDDTEPDTETERRPPVSEPPFNPSIISGPNTNNVQIRGRVDPPPVDADLPTDTRDQETRDQGSPVREPADSSAQRPSLHKALFTYALPVVCAWFGTIITDLI